MEKEQPGGVYNGVSMWELEVVPIQSFSRRADSKFFMACANPCLRLAEACAGPDQQSGSRRTKDRTRQVLTRSILEKVSLLGKKGPDHFAETR